MTRGGGRIIIKKKLDHVQHCNDLVTEVFKDSKSFENGEKEIQRFVENGASDAVTGVVERHIVAPAPAQRRR